MGFQIVRHDHENQCPARGPDGRCIMAAPGESGELLGLIKPNDPVSQFHGYTDKAATKKKIIEGCVAKGDRYFTTGDLVRKEDDGYVYFVDRIGDTFRWKGENVSTNEVGEVVSVFPGIVEANIYGVTVPGNEDGKACMAAIVTDGGAVPDMEALAQHCLKVRKGKGSGRRREKGEGKWEKGEGRRAENCPCSMCALCTRNFVSCVVGHTGP